MKNIRWAAAATLSFFFFNTVPVWAYAEPRRASERELGQGQDAGTFQDTFLRKTRLLQQKHELAALQEETEANTRRQGGSPQTSDPAPASPNEEITESDIVLVEAAALDPDATLIYNWTQQIQATSPLGLVVSYPEDPALANQAFTYDQALAGILFLKEGDAASAGKIFNFYNSLWNGTGFWTVYNSQDINGSKVEYSKIMGSNAWVALFALQYHSYTKDWRALVLATNIAKWIKALPRRDGGVAMGGAGTFWADKFSVENNLDYYAVTKLLSTRAATGTDKALFSNEKTAIKNWIKNQGYDSSTGLFRRGAYGDTVKALDTNSWAILALGVDAIKQDFGIDPVALIQRIENIFVVQSDGSFGGDALHAKGFDFSDSINASGAGRLGLKWVEGTAQVIDVYKLLANYYSTRNSTKASYYRARASYFTGLNENDAVRGTGTLGYLYTDQAGAQVFSDNLWWRTASGLSAASSAWVYFSTYSFNPFSQLITVGGGSTPPSATYPNDPYFWSSGSWGQAYSDLWGVHAVGVDDSVWSLYKGQGIKIGIVDSGVSYSQEDIVSNMWQNTVELNGLPGVDDDADGYIDDIRGWDFVNNDNNPLDENGHGTHVAGIAAATGNNSKGIIGVAPLAQIIPVRVLDRLGSGTIDAVAKGIEYAAKVGANIINLSLGAANLDLDSYTILQEAVDFARSLGSLIVAAAGNSNSDVDGFSPANLSGVIAVGATDVLDQRASFSNFGSKLFITAPGVDILSLGTKLVHIGTRFKDNYYRASGTSMAAPFVSGAIAILLNKYPGASLDLIASLLASGADDLGDPGWDPYYGYGRLDVAASLGISATLNASLASVVSSGTSLNSFSKMDAGVFQPSPVLFFSDLRFSRERAEEELAQSLSTSRFF